MRQTSILLAEMKETFLYFAYGSNLLTERIRINNPSSVKLAVANLKKMVIVNPLKSDEH